jgi:glycosyltransferase involved in cell wall biosynthesis
MDKPELSIVMPFYNTEKYIGDAVQSLLAQTYDNFELILVDDASTDGSAEVVKSLNDSRIKLLKNEINRGIVFSRNQGMKAAVGRFIAPFDSDDLARTDKFEKQIRFLKNNPDFGMVGSWARLIDEDGNLLKKTWKLTQPPARIPAFLLFKNLFVQSAVVMKREVVPENFYEDGFDLVEDYKMWIDISRIRKTCNYPDYLMFYRVHQSSATNKTGNKLLSQDARIYKYLFKPLEIDLDERMTNLLLLLKNDQIIGEERVLHEMEDFFGLILSQNQKLNIYSQTELVKVVFDRWLKACYKSRQMKFGMLKIFLNSRVLKTYLKNVL